LIRLGGIGGGRARAMAEAVTVRAMARWTGLLLRWAPRGSSSVGAPMAQQPLTLTDHVSREMQRIINLDEQAWAVIEQGRARINHDLESN